MNATQRALESATLALQRAADAATGYGTTQERLQQVTSAVHLYAVEDCWPFRLAALNHGELADARKTVEQVRTILTGKANTVDKVHRVAAVTARHAARVNTAAQQ